MLAILLSAALAWGATTEFQPHLHLSAVRVNGQSWSQLAAGATLGTRGRFDTAPWVWSARTKAMGIYGIESGSLGMDVRSGAFAGAALKGFLSQHGPDLFVTAYGRRGSADYYLPPAVGLALHNGAQVKVSKGAHLIGWFDPAWLLNASRNAHLGPFHELTLGSAVQIHSKALRATLGYQWAWNAAGRQDSLVLSAGL